MNSACGDKLRTEEGERFDDRMQICLSVFKKIWITQIIIKDQETCWGYEKNYILYNPSKRNGWKIKKFVATNEY